MNELKLQELERRIKLLERQSFESQFNYFDLARESLAFSKEHIFEFELQVKSNCYLLLESTVNGTIGGFIVAVSINGEEVVKANSDTASLLISRVLPFSSGKNLVSIKVTSQTTIAIKECRIKTFGNLQYVENFNGLCVLNESERSILLHLNNQSLSVKEYNGSLTEIFCLKKVKSASICKLGQNYLLTTVSLGGSAVATVYNSQFEVLNSANLDGEIYSVCSTSGTPARVYAVRGNRVYRYEIYEDLSIVVTQTEYRAKILTANASVSKYIIITDHSGNGKLIKIE